MHKPYNHVRTLAEVRRGRQRRCNMPVVKVLGFDDGKVRLSVCGVEQEVEIGHFVDFSALEAEERDRKTRKAIDLMHWLQEYPEHMPLGMLARQWCAVAGIKYKEESNGISWLYDHDRKRVHIYDGVWHYPLLTRKFNIYGAIEYLKPRIPMRYLTEDCAALLREKFIKYIKELQNQ